METQQIQRIQFKSLGGGAPSGGFNPFPYKTPPSSTPASGSSTVETIEKEKPSEPTFSAKDLQDTRQKSFEDGYSKGYNSAKSAEAETEKLIATNLADITLKLAAIGEVVKTRNNQHVTELVQLVIRIARKVAGDALQAEPYVPIENVIKQSLPLLFDEPKITIFVHTDLVAKIESRITSLAKSEGFRNIIEILGNPTLSPGSCDIEWNGGGIRSNKDAMWGEIEKLIGSL